ncbi:unnamed protein product [Tenebrio molitor]|nr:unnamed protein product [Tenebrio molitor]
MISFQDKILFNNRLQTNLDYQYGVIHLLLPVAKLSLKNMISFLYFADLIYYL